jgi:multidrug efflux pump subunit AcrA (membrane-fusion protein)
MWKWIVILVSLAGAAFAIRQTVLGSRPQPVPPPLKEPVRNPFPAGISGAGIVEPASENIVIGVSDPGLVMQVFVHEGQQVEKGAPLFRIDSRTLESELVTAEAAVRSAEAELQRVTAFRRKEDEPGLRARLAQSVANAQEAKSAIAQAEALVGEREWAVKDAEDRAQRLVQTVKEKATPENDLVRAQFQIEIERARLRTAIVAVAAAQAREKSALAASDAAKAELDTFLAGAWPPDVKKAAAVVEEASARVTRIKRDIERRTVQTPLSATVVRLSLKEGEYAAAGAVRPEDAPLVLGLLHPLHVRVDIDEFDAQRFKPGVKALAMFKSENGARIPLEFSHVEPFILPKRALTNSQRELVDTRVLQVIYKVGDEKAGLYVGQQLDVFLDTP